MEKRKNIILLIMALLLTCLMACVDEPPKETEPPVVHADQSELENHKEPEVIQEYPLITTADLEVLQGQGDTLDNGSNNEEEETQIENPIEEAPAELSEEEASEEEPEEEPEPEMVEPEEEAEPEEPAEEYEEPEPAEEVEPVTEEPAKETIEEDVVMVDEEETETGLIYMGTYQVTAYEWTGYACANGNYPEEGYTIACNTLPFGTRVLIEGVGERVVEDRGADWHQDNWIDLYLGDVAACYNWGVQYLDVWIIE